MYQDMFTSNSGGGSGSTTYTVTTIYKNGLQQGAVETSKSTSGTTVASDEGTYLKTSISNTANIYAWVGIKVDLTNINYVVFYDTSISSAYANGQGVYASPSIGGISVPSVYQLTTGTNKSFKIMLDVSSLSGENYVGIFSLSGSSGGAREARCNLIELVQVNFP